MQQEYSNWHKKVCKKMLVLADYTTNILTGGYFFWVSMNFIN